MSTAVFCKSLFQVLEMASIDLTVSVEETERFNYENRPVWPRVPTPCTVAECGPTHYNSFKSFIAHWIKMHHQIHRLYVCSCKRHFATRKHIKCHLKHEKDHRETESQMRPNCNYRDPGDKLPYQLGTVEDRNDMKILQKHLARKRRQEEADKFKGARDILCSSSRNNVCRDEAVKEREGRLVKDTNLWDSPKRRKRIDFK